MLRLLAGPLALLLWPGTLPALVPAPQSVARPEPEREAPQAREARSEARAAQRRFERLRRRWLPVTRSWSGSSCDEIVGRMCQNHDEGGDWWPGPEDPRIVEARRTLLQELEAWGGTEPSDPWILGQRVVYLGEAGEWPAAERVASECLPVHPARCGTLLGLALHAQGRYREAEEAFETALGALGPEERRRWRDPSVLLDGRGHDWLRRAQREGEAAYEGALAMLWRLADPLFLVEGNDRLTEHWARRALAEVRAEAVNPHGLSWGNDLEELLLRYGWEVGWERTAPAPGLREGIVGHQHPQSRPFLPPGWVLEDPAAVPPGSWGTHHPRPRSSYAPAYAPLVLPLEGEVMRMPHPAGVRLIATYQLPADTTRHAGHAHHPPFRPPSFVADTATRAGLFLMPLSGTAPPWVSRGVGPEGILLLEAPAGRHLLGLEVWSPGRGLAGRERHGLEVVPLPADVPTLSDLVRLADTIPPGTTLDGALRGIRAWGPLPAGRSVVVGWEVQGLGWRPGERLAYRLTLQRHQEGLLARVGRWLGLVGPPRAQALAWEESGPPGPEPVFRSVTLEIPELEEGLYLLRLELAIAGRTSLASERAVVVRP